MTENGAAQGVRWAVEAWGVVLVHEGTGATVTLGYPQAAIWDFLTREETSDRIAERREVIASLDPAGAKALVVETVTALREAGFLYG